MKTKGIEWLDREMKKDEKELERNKEKMILSLKNLDKNELFLEPERKKLSLKEKILKIFGYGK